MTFGTGDVTAGRLHFASMSEAFRNTRTPHVVGVVTWAAVGVPFVLIWRDDPSSRSLAAAAAYLAFGAAFFFGTRLSATTLCGQTRVLFLVAQTVSALAMISARSTGFEPILLVLVASQLVFSMSLNRALVWVGVQTALYAVILAFRFQPLSATIQVTAYLSFQAFALYTGHVAEREASARAELTRLNAELQGTRELLAESSRLSERMRIARDLHDVLGHHLTALSLNLEVATHLTEGKGKESVEKARSIAKLLLADVRAVVQEFRSDERLDLTRALAALTSGIPRPIVHLALAPGLAVTDGAVAETLLRCVQEIVTNAVKHAEAENLWIDVGEGPSGYEVKARDDGRGSAAVAPGNGLTGMTHRLADVRGSLSWETRSGAGFAIAITVPR